MSGVATFDPQPRRPAWGVRTPRRKYLATGVPIVVAPPPAEVVLPLLLGPGVIATPIVRQGERVARGQPLGATTGVAGVRLHASISGEVVGLETCAVAGSPPGPGIRIRSDGKDERWAGGAPLSAYLQLGPAELRAHLAEGGLVGLGGARFPTATKLAGGATQLLVNGAECEPYISCDDMLLRERAARVVAGTQILLAALGGDRAVIAVKTDMPEARVALYNALRAVDDARLGLSVVTAKYPAGGERQLIELVFHREVPAGKLPADVGIICQNVATAVAAADLVLDGNPLTSRVITVTGGGVRRPCNIEARLGTPIRDLVALAGGYHGEPRRLIMGGPMMGIALADDELSVTAATNSLLIATAAELGKPIEPLPCIRCGACIEVCPARLLPQELWMAADPNDRVRLEALHVEACIECGACDYACPSHLPLTQTFARAKGRT